MFRSVNQQVWQKLETHVRNIAEGLGDDTLFVTTGPIFKGTAQATEKADGKKIDVPSAYFKVIAKVTRDASCRVTDAKTVGYIIPNELNLSTDYSKWIKSVAEVEKETGFILFPDIPQNYKEKATTTW